MNAIVVEALGTSRLETSDVARKMGVSRSAAMRALRNAEIEGLVVSAKDHHPAAFRRGCAQSLIWTALARVKGHKA